MSKLIMMSGLPASGKSTFAKDIAKKDGNTIRVNRDLLREMLHFDVYSSKNEVDVVDVETLITKHFLDKGVNVIVDDCNLNPKNLEMWKRVAKENNHKFEKKFIDTHWTECSIRDANREKSVGRQVITNMALQYEMIKFSKGSVVICDLDGTLCDISHRIHHVSGETKNWKLFFAGISKDKIRKDVFDMIKTMYDKEDKQIIFVSGRPDTYKQQTLAWLRKNDVSFGFTLIMRKENDTRPDTEVKKQILDTYFKDKSCIYKVIDDRPSVIRMWKKEGLDVIDVGSGIEF